MYKVFIENKPLFFVKNTKDLPKDAICYFGEINSELLTTIEHLYKEKSTKVFFAIISDKPLKSLIKLFKDFKYIEAGGGIVRKVKNGKLLFIKRNGFWDIPKGKIEKKESQLNGAIREIEEECGISNISHTGNICTTFHTYKMRGKNCLKKTYWYSFDYYGNEKLVAQAEEGISKVKWFKINKLNKVWENTFLSIIEVIEEYIQEK